MLSKDTPEDMYRRREEIKVWPEVLWDCIKEKFLDTRKGSHNIRRLNNRGGEWLDPYVNFMFCTLQSKAFVSFYTKIIIHPWYSEEYIICFYIIFMYIHYRNCVFNTGKEVKDSNIIVFYPFLFLQTTRMYVVRHTSNRDIGESRKVSILVGPNLNKWDVCT